MNEILVLYYSRYGATEALAREVCRGVDSVKASAARLRTVPPVSTVAEASEDTIPETGPPYVDSTDLDECNGHTTATPDFPDGIYHYHVTATFPYISGCYRGTPGSVTN